jgi:predicted DNA-binding WGR domain protein/DNA-directed RNA polymerase subunit RPC12/RpoP
MRYVPPNDAVYTIYIENTEPGHQKFWQCWVVGKEFTARWGKIGIQGQNQTKGFSTPQAAVRHAETIADAKQRNGYVAPEEDLKFVKASPGSTWAVGGYLPGSTQRYGCSKCKRVFSSLKKRDDHVSQHDELHRCDTCGDTFNSQPLMVEHMINGHASKVTAGQAQQGVGLKTLTPVKFDKTALAPLMKDGPIRHIDVSDLPE